MKQLTSLRKISNNATLPTENNNCRKASMNGIDSMSPKNKKYKLLKNIKFKRSVSDHQVSLCLPTVPPNSITHTSAGPSFPSTGMTETDSIQFLMASVTCGTTWNPIKDAAL